MYLPRTIEDILIKSVHEFPVIALMGPRQVGKSTLLQHLFEDEYTYITFDDMAVRSQAVSDPALFLKNNPGKLILDEIQYAPEILPEIKMHVDDKKMPGQYIITGSQQFNIISGMQESLAGRVLLLKLPAMTLQEKTGYGKKQHWLPELLRKGTFDKDLLLNYPETVTPVHMIYHGGLPGLLEKSESFIPSFFNSYIQTYLERDIPSQFKTANTGQIGRFLALLAPLSSHEINKSQLGREIGISPPTADRWLSWLKSSLVWREHLPYSGNMIKRVSKHSKGYIFDTGIICSLMHIASPDTLTVHPFIGNLFETVIRIELDAVINNYLLPAYLYHWRTQYGHEVDIVIEFNSKLFAFECKWSTKITKDDLRGLREFRKNYTNSVAFTGIITPYGNARFVDDLIVQIPWFQR